jgi:hypothetical protein
LEVPDVIRTDNRLRVDGRAAFRLLLHRLAYPSRLWDMTRDFGRSGDQSYHINDDQAGFFYDLWSKVDVNNRLSINDFTKSVCSNEALWGVSLSSMPGFVDTVSTYLFSCIHEGVEKLLHKVME